MSVLSAFRRGLNVLLRPLNMRLDTLTVEKIESRRLLEADSRGQFDGLQFSVDQRFESSMAGDIVRDIKEHSSVFESWRDPSQNTVGFTLDNEYFGSPDAEVLYAMIRRLRPRRIIEIGSGNSTRIMRMAVSDGAFPCELVSIDPAPRRDVERIADRVLRQRAETNSAESIAGQLDAGDVLFIDSSHEIRTGGDVPFIYLQVMPLLREGVIIHIHDIFHPFDYPRDWVIDKKWTWNEQYLVSAILQHDPALEVLWAGHYLQRMQPELLPQFSRGRASSLWIRKGPGGRT